MNDTPVSFPSGDVTLAGTMVTPAGTAPFPTALLIAGSGPLDRDANHKRIALNLSRDLARILADAGWASLRFDKRGVGASGGEYLSAGFFDELGDVTAAYCWMGEQAEVGTMIAVGHSGGALQAVELASREPSLAGAVLLATSVKTGEETLRWQTQKLQNNIVPAPVKALLKLFGTSVVKQQAKTMKRLKATTTDTERIQFVKINAKWMREFIAYDPVPALQTAQVPLLAITGSKDTQVDPQDLLAVTELRPGNTTTRIIEDVDHLLRHEPAAFSNPRKYRKQIKNPIDQRVTATLVEWLRSIPTTDPTKENREANDV